MTDREGLPFHFDILPNLSWVYQYIDILFQINYFCHVLVQDSLNVRRQELGNVSYRYCEVTCHAEVQGSSVTILAGYGMQLLVVEL